MEAGGKTSRRAVRFHENHFTQSHRPIASALTFHYECVKSPAMSLSENTIGIELLKAVVPRPKISHAIFDFDGTVSWLRHAWPEIMADLYREYLPLRKDETADMLGESIIGEILALNGKPTIHQVIRLQELAAKRGVATPEPESLRQAYQRLLDEKIRERSARIVSSEVERDSYAVFGVRNLLERLRERGVKLYVLSGTVEHRVREEAELLDVAKYFDGGINGSPSDGESSFTKKGVIERILREERIQGDQLLSFGDGRIEIANTKEVGGLAVAVASNEDVNGCGIMDPWKRAQLADAGADIAIADYRETEALLQALFGK